MDVIFKTLEAQGRTQQWLARQLGIHRSLLAHYKRGSRTAPDWVIRQSAQLLGLPESVIATAVLPDGNEAPDAA